MQTHLYIHASQTCKMKPMHGLLFPFFPGHGKISSPSHVLLQKRAVMFSKFTKGDILQSGIWNAMLKFTSKAGQNGAFRKHLGQGTTYSRKTFRTDAAPARGKNGRCCFFVVCQEVSLKSKTQPRDSFIARFCPRSQRIQGCCRATPRRPYLNASIEVRHCNPKTFTKKRSFGRAPHYFAACR